MRAGLLVPSGTMANLLAVLVHCGARGEEMLVRGVHLGGECRVVQVGDRSHLHLWEQGGAAMVGGVHTRTLHTRSSSSSSSSSLHTTHQGGRHLQSPADGGDGAGAAVAVA